MIYFVDIDKTICDYPDGIDVVGNYHRAIPNYHNIELINELYRAGHIIVYWTARGMKTSRAAELYSLTASQLMKWDCSYHELRMGKPMYDRIIDDKALRIEELE